MEETKIVQPAIFEDLPDGMIQITKIGDCVSYIFQGKRVHVERGPKALDRYRAIVALMNERKEHERG